MSERDGLNVMLRRDATVELDAASVDAEARTVSATLSTEAPVDRWFGAEILEHSKEAVDTSRAARGLPLLFAHRSTMPLGNVRDLAVVDGKLKGTLHFNASRLAEDIWPQVRDGFLSSVSIGYQVRKWEEDVDTETRTAKRWTLFEASVVTIPADLDAEIASDARALHEELPALQRLLATLRAQESEAFAVTLFDQLRGASAAGTHEDETMPPESPDPTVVDLQTVTHARESGISIGMQRERERRAGIEALFAMPRYQGPEFRSLCDDLINTGHSIEAARSKLLEALGTGSFSVSGPAAPAPDDAQRGEHISQGRDQRDKFLDGATEALMVRSGLQRDKAAVASARKGELFGLSLSELAREHLRRGNADLAGLSREQIIGECFVPGTYGIRAATSGSLTASDFKNLLSNVQAKAALIGFEETEETWGAWCRRGRLDDYKEASRVGMSNLAGLRPVGDVGGYEVLAFSDLGEKIRIARYGGIVPISREAIVNDDLDMLSRLPRLAGRAAAATVGDLAYGVLTTNPDMNEDATALFHADHSNYFDSTAGGAPSVALLTTMNTALRLQRSPKPNSDDAELGRVLNIRGRFLLVPVALEVPAMNLVANEFDPDATAGTLKKNPFQSRYEVVADPRLDAEPLAWYVAADPDMHDTVEIAFLDGNEAPMIEESSPWRQDGVEMKVRLEVGAAPLGWRGLQKNKGES